jgi:hypothetical protein
LTHDCTGGRIHGGRGRPPVVDFLVAPLLDDKKGFATFGLVGGDVLLCRPGLLSRDHGYGSKSSMPRDLLFAGKYVR